MSITGLDSVRRLTPPSAAAQPSPPGTRSTSSTSPSTRRLSSISPKAARAAGRSSGAHTGPSWSARPWPMKRVSLNGPRRMVYSGSSARRSAPDHTLTIPGSPCPKCCHHARAHSHVANGSPDRAARSRHSPSRRSRSPTISRELSCPALAGSPSCCSCASSCERSLYRGLLAAASVTRTPERWAQIDSWPPRVQLRLVRWPRSSSGTTRDCGASR